MWAFKMKETLKSCSKNYHDEGKYTDTSFVKFVEKVSRNT